MKRKIHKSRRVNAGPNSFRKTKKLLRKHGVGMKSSKRQKYGYRAGSAGSHAARVLVEHFRKKNPDMVGWSPTRAGARKVAANARKNYTGVRIKKEVFKAYGAADPGPGRIGYVVTAKSRKNSAGVHRQKKRCVRKNPDAEVKAAQHMFKKFHGRKSTGSRIVDQTRVVPSTLADCGRMVELVVDDGSPKGARITFPVSTKVRCATTGDGGQLYFVGGDQAIGLRPFGVTLPKDHVDLGDCVSIAYHTSKDFHNFEPSDYEHAFGEEGGECPTLHYDVHSKRLYLTGGTYRVKREGIVN
jgi:hypothetical protein